MLACGTSTKRRGIVCPYHSWAYELNGDLRSATGFKDQPGFDASQWSLLPLPVVEWHGLIFVDGSGKAAPLQDRLADLEEIVAPTRWSGERSPAAMSTKSPRTGRS